MRLQCIQLSSNIASQAYHHLYWEVWGGTPGPAYDAYKNYKGSISLSELSDLASVTGNKMERTNHPSIQHAIDRSFEDQIQAANQSVEDEYFASTKAPDYLPVLEKQVADFLAYHEGRRKIAIVTSGGTTVPLENNTVRFIDNFSAGTRGSTSAEWFIDHGYAVIFIYREFSLMPYSHRYASHSVLSLMKVVDGKLEIRPEHEEALAADVARYQEVKRDNISIEAPFTTVNQYLHTLKMVGNCVRPYGSAIMFYLAAAVSDFFLPMSKVSEHKIQSSATAKLVIDSDPVPKFLRSLTQNWTPSAMIVSFKLETDSTILIEKCRKALEKYGHQLVVGNLLQTRKDEVFLVTPLTEEHVLRGDSPTIESVFLPRVQQLHEEYIAKIDR